MTDTPSTPERDFAVHVVESLRRHGFEALWAGGCVRDQLLGRTPKDYDVATSARPDAVREVFGKRRTLPIGAAFGVINVLGPRGAGQIEVATFREDAQYSDGRRPDSVAFSDARQDALRRDFTMNGLFYDPIENEVHDYVNGREDLAAGVVRAIRDPYERIAEDKLRMLRAVRFAATFQFTIEENTWQAVQQEAASIHVVSAERIAAEMKRMLLDPNRRRAAELLRDSGLLLQILPESAGWNDQASWIKTLRLLEQLHSPTHSMALAALLYELCDQGANSALARIVCKRWRLSNEDTDGAEWITKHASTILNAAKSPWSQVQRLMISPRANELLAFCETLATVQGADRNGVDLCRVKLAEPEETLNPPPLISGNDLRTAKIPAGPIYKSLLDAIRDAQLNGQVSTAEEALEFAKQEWRRRT